MSYFPPYSHNKNRIEVELNLSNYATKSDLKNATVVDTSQFVKKDYLTSLKLEINKLGIDELKKLFHTSDYAQQYKIVKLQTYDLSHFISQSYFFSDEAQLRLILQPLY